MKITSVGIEVTIENYKMYSMEEKHERNITDNQKPLLLPQLHG